MGQVRIERDIMGKTIVRASFVISMALACCFGLTANATIITVNLTATFSGTDPAAEPPWARVIFDDSDDNGKVTLTLDAFNLSGSEYVGEWYLNFGPNTGTILDPTGLTFSLVSKTGSFADPTSIELGTNSYKADGDGKFDIKFSFATNAADRFEDDEKIVYEVAYSGGSIFANSFAELSALPFNNGIWYSAAHVQSIGSNSGWIGGDQIETKDEPVVPEPSALAIWGLGLAAVAFCRRRRV